MPMPPVPPVRRALVAARAPRRPSSPLRALCVLCGLALTAAAGSAQTTASDYARAEQFLPWNAKRLVSGDEVTPSWLPDDRFWFRSHTPDGHAFVLVDPARGVRRPAFDHERLAAALSVAAETAFVAVDLPFERFEYVDGERAIRFHVADSARWTCDLTEYRCRGPERTARPPESEIAAPVGDLVAFAKEENLWVRPKDAPEASARQLSRDGAEHWGFAVQPEGCCQEITNRRRGRTPPPVLAWSPDGRRIATHRYDERNVEELHLLEAADGRPILHTYRYALPGDSVIPTFTIHVFDAASGARVDVDAPPIPGNFARADSIWADVQWSDDGARLYFTRRTRDFKRLELVEADAATGATRRILEETGPTFLETAPPMVGGRQNWRVLPGGREALWWSERDGWGHLYLYDVAAGAPKRQLTAGQWNVFEIEHVDSQARQVWFTGVGRERGRDPYLRHLYRVSLDGGAPELLTPEDADHAISASPSGRFFVDTYSTRTSAPVTVVRDRNGRVLQTVEEGDVARLLAAGWQWPTPFTAEGDDGTTDVHGYLYFPRDFDPARKYPVLDYVYPGPQHGSIGFRSFNPGTSGYPHALAELGFIVFMVDAIGSPLRSKAFHDAWYGDMRHNGIPDHIAALKQLALRYPQLDLDRVGIFGHSGGGFASTDAILRYPDFFKVAVSGAGNHDNRGYHFPWGEKYQGLLERDTLKGGDNFDRQANQGMAANLEGKLLLTYGTLDDNVHPNMTLRVAEELIEANRTFDMLVFPNRNHGYAGEPYVIRRTWDYFVEHLKGETPPEDYWIQPPPE